MYVYDQLINAQIEVKATDYAAGKTGRIWWNTADGQAKLDNGTTIRSFLQNDGKVILGNHATAAQNIRLHKGAAALLQFVTADDATAEASLSTALAQISFKFESYTDAGKPAAGRAGRVIWISDLSLLKYDNGATWNTFSAGTEGIGSGGIETKSGAYVVTSSDSGKVFLCDTTSAAFALTLPAAAASFKFSVIDKGGVFATNNITVTRAAAESIQGLAANYALQSNWGRWDFFCDGTNWFIG